MKLFTQCVQTLELHIASVQNRYGTHSCATSHTSMHCTLSKSYCVNSVINIHTIQFLYLKNCSRTSHMVWFFLSLSAFFLLGCVGVYETVHMVGLWYHSHTCVYDVQMEWISYPFCVIVMCNSNLFLDRSQSHGVNNFTKSHVKNAVAFRKNRTVWTTL